VHVCTAPPSFPFFIHIVVHNLTSWRHRFCNVCIGACSYKYDIGSISLSIYVHPSAHVLACRTHLVPISRLACLCGRRKRNSQMCRLKYTRCKCTRTCPCANAHTTTSITTPVISAITIKADATTTTNPVPTATTMICVTDPLGVPGMPAWPRSFCCIASGLPVMGTADTAWRGRALHA